jgi:hypothetical protein
MISRITTRFSSLFANLAAGRAGFFPPDKLSSLIPPRRAFAGFFKPLPCNGLRAALSLAGARLQRTIRPAFLFKFFLRAPRTGSA